MKSKIFILLIIVWAGVCSSCSDFLDELPDNRTELDSNEKIRKLLVSAYPNASYAYINEMMSDNTDETSGSGWSNEDLQVEAYNWRDITDMNEDGVDAIWEACYAAIASANAALEAIEERGNPDELKAQRGEALVCRAYGHFFLVTEFSKMYSPLDSASMGIPYITEPETEVNPPRDRGTVGGVYRMIEKDLEEGIPLIDNSSYDVPKYHFNKSAAYAFAARFYLFYHKYDKVIEYAGKVLGNDPSTVLRNWEALGKLSPNDNIQANTYIAVDDPANLIIIPAVSYWGYVHGPYATRGTRYTHGKYLNDTETMGSRNAWGTTALTGGPFQTPFYTYSTNKASVLKLGAYTEYTDPVAKTAYIHIMHPVFTTDETLLCRAEAYILKKDYTNALADMNKFMRKFVFCQVIKDSTINDFYGKMNFYTPKEPTTKKQLNPDFQIEPGTQENFIYCLLHIRRMLTMHEGLRWFDIRRYGIEIYRRTLGGETVVTDKLGKDDPRRTIQLPQDVINAGLTGNPR